MNAGRSSVILVTKTGVAHFALQFWQLKKTDNFLNVCFAIFLVKLHCNCNIQSVVNIQNCNQANDNGFVIFFA